MPPDDVTGMDDVLRARESESLRDFYRALSASSPNAYMCEMDGVLASVAPARPENPLLNAVLYESVQALRRTLPKLTEIYRRAGVTDRAVWVWPGHEHAARVLAASGGALHARLTAMAAPLEELDIEPRGELALDQTPDWATIAALNDAAHGIEPTKTMRAILAGMDDPTAHLYVVCDGHTPVSCLVARDTDGDCSISFVATAPAARGRGLMTECVRTALSDAAARGCRTASLEATNAARHAYERLGYRTLGELEVWALPKPHTAGGSADNDRGPAATPTT